MSEDLRKRIAEIKGRAKPSTRNTSTLGTGNFFSASPKLTNFATPEKHFSGETKTVSSKNMAKVMQAIQTQDNQKTY